MLNSKRTRKRTRYCHVGITSWDKFSGKNSVSWQVQRKAAWFLCWVEVWQLFILLYDLLKYVNSLLAWMCWPSGGFCKAILDAAYKSRLSSWRFLTTLDDVTREFQTLFLLSKCLATHCLQKSSCIWRDIKTLLIQVLQYCFMNLVPKRSIYHCHTVTAKLHRTWSGKIHFTETDYRRFKQTRYLNVS